MILNFKGDAGETAVMSTMGGLVAAGVGAAAGAAIAPPLVAGALVVGALAISNKVVNRIRDGLFTSRVDDLAQFAESLGVDPQTVVVMHNTDQQGDNFRVERPWLLSDLIGNAKLTRHSNEVQGSVEGHWRISSKQVAAAKAAIRGIANERGTATTRSTAVDPFEEIVNMASESLKAKGATGVIREGNKDSGTFVGTVVAKTAQFLGIDIGKNMINIVPNRISSGELAVGQKVNLKYQNGIGKDLGRGQSASLEQGRGR